MLFIELTEEEQVASTTRAKNFSTGSAMFSCRVIQRIDIRCRDLLGHLLLVHPGFMEQSTEVV